ncbi:MAG TPA: DUF1569 domain-containing protein [Pirellulales bacterium]
MAERRVLDFAGIEELMPEVERLLFGYETLGQWTLGQICNHLARAIHYSAESPPATEPPTREQDVTRKLFFRGRFPDGRPAPPGTEPRPGLDDIREAEKLRAAIARFGHASGPGPLHPRIGPLTHEEWERFHCLHAAHHLGFAVPK